MTPTAKSQHFLITVEEEQRPSGSAATEGEAKRAKVTMAYIHVKQ